MKKILTILALFLPASPAAAAVQVVATTTDLASIVRAVGGDLVDVEALCPANQDPHRVAATPGMVVRLSRADLLVANGLDLEVGWLPSLRRSARGNALYVDASVRVPLLEVPGGAVDRSMGDVHPYGNPHYTLDPVRAKRAAWNVANGLNRVDPANSAVYNRRLTEFYAKVDAAVARARTALAPYAGAGVVVYHKRYEYLLDRLGLREAAAIEPLPGVPPSAAHVARLIEGNRRAGVRAVVVEPWNDRRLADRVGEGLGARVAVLTPAVGADAAATDVVTLFERNVAMIVEALEASGPSS